jgi:3-oxoacyl-(acyl-carrier-protein) synthase
MPFAAAPGGMTVGEGAAFALLEREHHDAPFALNGVGESSDAHHVTAPDPEGRGAAQALRAALRDAGADADDLDHVNAHGTGTRLNDDAEALALAEVCPAVPVVASKGATGHTLGAAGAIEAVLTLMALHSPTRPPRTGSYAARPDVALVPAREDTASPPRRRRALALSSSFAFGGSNVVLALSCRGRG